MARDLLLSRDPYKYKNVCVLCTRHAHLNFSTGGNPRYQQRLGCINETIAERDKFQELPISQPHVPMYVLIGKAPPNRNGII